MNNNTSNNFNSGESESNLLISFLGAAQYKPSGYHYSELNQTVFCKYGATAFLYYIQHYHNVQIDKIMICGTKSSFWTDLPDYLAETAELIFDTSPDYESIRNSLSAIKTQPFFKELQKLITENLNSTADNSEQFQILLKELEDNINAAVGSAGKNFRFIIHAEEFSSYDSQVELLNKIKNSDLMSSRPNIYLDITYGLRIMPFMVFISFQSLCYTENLKIRKICYSPEVMPKTEPLDRLSFLEKIKNRLRYLRETDNELYQSKLQQINAVLPSSNRGKNTQTPVKIKQTECCFLDSVYSLLKDASMLSRFNVTADPAVFSEIFHDKMSSDNVTTAEILREISFYLNICDYQKAAELISSNNDKITAEIKNPQLAAVLKNSFKWGVNFAKNSQNRGNQCVALKMLSAMNLQCYDYVHAVNSCYAAIDEYQFPCPGQDRQDKLEQRNRIKKEYPAFKEFIDLFRAMFIHLKDNTANLENPDTRISRILNSADGGRLDEQHLREQLLDHFASLDVKPKKTKDSVSHVMFSFIGSGDYGHTSYIYTDPFHREIHDYDIDNSAVIGISLAKKILSVDAADERKLTKLVVCGTRTSNWSRILAALSEEFFEPLKQENQDVYRKYCVLQSEIEKSVSDDLNASGSISHASVCSINKFFLEIRDILHFQIIFAVTGDDISSSDTQHAILQCILDNVDFNDQVSFDITHCYRIIPIISLCAVLYLKALKNITVQHIFYGDVPLEKDFNSLNGLKKSQLGSDSDFTDLKNRIEEILADCPYEKLLAGQVYDMRNLAKLLEYSSSINEFISTRNLQFLQPLIKVELRKRDYENYVNFCNGIILDSLSLFTAAAEKLNPAVEKIREGINDPVLKTVESAIYSGLEWIDDAGKGRFDLIMTKKARNYILNNRFAEASNCLYQAMVEQATQIKNIIFSNFPNNIELTESAVKAKDCCDPLIKNIADALNSKLGELKNPGKYNLINIFAASKKKDEGLFNRAISSICYITVRKPWGFIQELRNLTVHHNKQGNDEIQNYKLKEILSLPEANQVSVLKKHLLNTVIPEIESIGNLFFSELHDDKQK